MKCQIMKKTIRSLLVLLFAVPLAVCAADSTTTLWFDQLATNFHQSLPLGQRAHRRDGVPAA